MMEPPASLSQDFLDEYQVMALAYDQTAADSFQGHKLERLVCEFIKRHSSQLAQFPLTVDSPAFAELVALPPSQQANKPTSGDLLDEDLRIVDNEARLEAPQQARLLADLYRRACQAAYLRVTFNKSRLGREDERREPVHWGRHALRLDPDSFAVAYWYMICEHPAPTERSQPAGPH